MRLCGPCIYTWHTHTFSCSDVDRAGDVGEALIHAHLQVDHPAKKRTHDWCEHLTEECTHITCSSACLPVYTHPGSHFVLLASGVEYTPRSTLPILAALWARKHADIDIKAKPLKRSGSSPPTKGISSVWISPRPLLWKPQTAQWLLILQSSLLISAAKNCTQIGWTRIRDGRKCASSGWEDDNTVYRRNRCAGLRKQKHI